MPETITHLIDLNFQDVPGAIGVYALEHSDGLTIMELGPASTLDNLAAGLRTMGLSLDEVKDVFLTHVHLDHAGAAGSLARRNPNVTIHVHELAAPVLIDTAPLLASATRSFGDNMKKLWGDVLDVPAEQIDPIQAGTSFDVSGTTIDVLAAPGHAGTHLAYLDRQSGYLFTGDSAGARLQGSEIVIPTLAPPDLDFDAWRDTIDRLRAAKPTALALTHFGVFEDVDRHLDQIMPGIEESEALAAQILHSADDQDRLDEAIQQRNRTLYEAEGGDVEAKVHTMQFGMPAYLGAQGLVRVFKKSGRLT